MDFNYYIPTRILFGSGKIRELRHQRFPGRKALIVISNNELSRNLGHLSRVEHELIMADIKYRIFDHIQVNPTKRNVIDGVALAREESCDFIIGLGGGSCMDAAKAIAVIAPNDDNSWRHMKGIKDRDENLTHRPLPVVVISTTAGTGSEVGSGIVITKEETKEKIGYSSRDTFPYFSIIDPELTLTVPPQLTAFQGFGALFRSTEGFISLGANPISNLYALQAIKILGKNLPLVIHDGQNIKLRENLALANVYAGMVDASASSTSGHSLEHALSAYFPKLPHGAGLIMISSAYYSHFARHHACDEKLLQMAQALGKKDAQDTLDFVQALNKLKQDCGVDQLKMSDYGIKKEDLPLYAKNAISVVGELFDFDPLPLSEDDCIAILEESYK
ncbi:MAG: iron-containing alcohol dehydrogenase [Bacillota bacterium]|jgi:alcohol dehydrogenase